MIMHLINNIKSNSICANIDISLYGTYIHINNLSILVDTIPSHLKFVCKYGVIESTEYTHNKGLFWFYAYSINYTYIEDCRFKNVSLHNQKH